MAYFIEFTTPHRDEHMVEVRCRATAGGFSGEASAYFGIDGATTMGASLQDFADGLSQYPIPDTGGIPLRNGFEEGDDHATEVVTMRLQPFGTGNRGQVYVEVELTNQPGVPLPGGGTNCAATLTR